jgi:hypothetical protein
MTWIAVVGNFVGGACLTNAAPHLVAGLTGRAFPTQLSRRAGAGFSSPLVNFVWGWTNAAVGFALLFQAGTFGARSATDIALLLAGSFLTGAIVCVHFGNVFSIASSELRSLPAYPRFDSRRHSDGDMPSRRWKVREK